MDEVKKFIEEGWEYLSTLPSGGGGNQIAASLMGANLLFAARVPTLI